MTSISIGQRFQAKVEDLSQEGLGVLRFEGQVFFALGSWLGDEGIFEVETLEKRYGNAKLVELLKPSSERRDKLPCPHQGFSKGECGGCPWMIATDEAQTIAKQKRLEHALTRAQITVEKLSPIHCAPKTLQYRNRAQFKIASNQIGYVSANSKDLAPIDDCVVLNETMSHLFQEAKKRFLQNPVTSDQHYPDHPWAFLDLDDEVKTSEVSDLKINRRRAFRQGNTEQNQFMQDFLNQELSHLPRHLNVVELYAGSGNFTQVLVDLKFTKITAVEVVPQALENLKKRFPHIETLRMDLAKAAHFHILGRKLKNVEVLLLDPPRDGARGIEHLVSASKKLKTIIYVSCNLNSFLRDAQKLKGLGFSLEKLQPLDQFPQTPHLELIGVFTTPLHLPLRH